MLIAVGNEHLKNYAIKCFYTTESRAHFHFPSKLIPRQWVGLAYFLFLKKTQISLVGKPLYSVINNPSLGIG